MISEICDFPSPFFKMKMRNEARQVVSQSTFIYSLWFHLAYMATINTQFHGLGVIPSMLP